MANQTPLGIIKDINGIPSWGLVPSVQGTRIVLGADTLQNFTVPSGPSSQYLAVFSFYSGADVWVQFDTATTLTLPTASAVDSTAELNPTARWVPAGATIQLRAVSANSGVGVKYYALQPTLGL